MDLPAGDDRLIARELFIAVMDGRIDDVKFLIANQRYDHAELLNAINAVVGCEENICFEILTFLHVNTMLNLNAQNKAEDCVLTLACKYNEPEIVRLLGKIEYLDWTVRDYHLLTGLSNAIKRKNVACAIAFLEANHSTSGTKLDLNTTTSLFKCNYLSFACKYGCEEVVEKILELSEGNYDLNKVDNLGITALMYACSSGIKQICNLLMSQEGVNITERDNNDLDALFHACGGCDDVDLIKTLIKLGCDPLREIQEGWTCLHTASLKGNHEIVEYFLENVKGININGTNRCGETPLVFASMRGHVHVAKLLLSKGAKVNVKMVNTAKTPLYIASEMGHAFMVEPLVQQNADINGTNAEGNTPLVIACGKALPDSKRRYLETVEFLISNGANVNKQGQLMTPLISAAKAGNVEVLQMLLKSGADVNQTNQNGYTALMMAVLLEREDCVIELLSDSNIDVNIQRSNDANTALICAAARQELEIAKAICDKGARLDLQNKKGKIAENYAKNDVKKMLKSYWQ